MWEWCHRWAQVDPSGAAVDERGLEEVLSQLLSSAEVQAQEDLVPQECLQELRADAVPCLPSSAPAVEEEDGAAKEEGKGGGEEESTDDLDGALRALEESLPAAPAVVHEEADVRALRAARRTLGLAWHARMAGDEGPVEWPLVLL